MKLYPRSFALAALALLAACSQTAAPPLDAATWKPGTGSVSGYVVNRKAGTDVAGTVVTLAGTAVSTTTNEHGFYRLFGIPAGFADLTFTQDGYATSAAKGLRVGDRAETKYSTIQAEAFDPFLPTVSPELNVSLENGSSVPGGDDGTLSFTVSGSVASPNANKFYSLGTVGLGQSRGTSGFLNASVPGTSFGFGGGETEVTVSTAGFEGDTSVHIVAYDGNFNRTEVVRYVNVGAPADEADLGDVADLSAFAVTFGDTAVFGSLSTGNQAGAHGGFSAGSNGGFSGAELMKAVRAGDLDALKNFSPTQSVTTQGYLDEGLIWTDVTFEYDGDTLPTGFRIYRKLLGRPAGGLIPIAQISPAQASVDPENEDNTSYLYRDTSAGLEAGVKTQYRVEAFYGDSVSTSEDAFVTPLPILDVDALSPENDAVNVSVSPTYDVAVENRDNLLYVGAIVLDRVHAEGSSTEWLFVTVDQSGAAEVSIPHNANGAAVNEELQPFHGYDWQPIAVTSNGTVTSEGELEGENAISVGADFFDVFGVGFGVSDGPVNTFSTGDGSF